MKVKILTDARFSFGHRYVGQIFDAVQKDGYVQITLIPQPFPDIPVEEWNYLNSDVEVVEE